MLEVTMKENRDIAIVGGGFSGGMLLVQLIRQATTPLSITLINAGYPLIRGIAYSTNDDTHLLNVRAGRMSAFPDDALHFVKWIRAQQGDGYREWQTEDLPERFVPRSMYGAYLDDVLKESLANVPAHVQVDVVQDEVTDLEQLENGYRVHLKSGASFTAQRVAITTGHAAAHRLPGNVEAPAHEAVVLNPWTNDITKGVDRDKDVMIIGAGLTMADTVLSFLQNNHAGTIHVLSRHGVLPIVHPVVRLAHNDSHTIVPDSDLHSLYAQVKKQIRDSFDEEVWQEPVLEDIRPHTQRIWQEFSPEQKKRFVRHLSSKWQRLRHRLPIEIASQLQAAIDRGQLKLYAGNLAALKTADDGITVHWNDRKKDASYSVTAARVINCTGPETNLERNGSLFVKNLLQRGLIRPCALRLGYDATPDGKIIGGNGAVTPNLYTMGPALRGILWESVAVPELKGQAKELAAQLIG